MDGKIFILDIVGDITTFVVDGVLLVKVSDTHGGAAIHSLGKYTGELKSHVPSNDKGILGESMEELINMHEKKFHPLIKKGRMG